MVAHLVYQAQVFIMRWPPFEHVFFDCDSTLTTIEGIDVLADTEDKRRRVEALTQAAMDGEVDLDEIYAERLQALKPTRRQVFDLRNAYKRHMVEDADLVIGALHKLGHKVYIISGGLLEPVAEFGISLGVPRDRIRAVHIAYNELSGQWWEGPQTDDQLYLTYTAGALTVSDGKAQIVRELMGDQRGRSLLIGDGMSDYHAAEAVDLFVGYGGVAARAKVREAAPAYLESQSLAPLLALAGGPGALRTLGTWTTEYQLLASKVRHLLHQGAIIFNDEQLESRFQKALLDPQ
ncbi:MAG TPA: haloacid dehalogenase-like hydrolase [Promineifilum sp.]|nr:haloacid dehalogenase-like hydrolase [Promineifilum sp.]